MDAHSVSRSLGLRHSPAPGLFHCLVESFDEVYERNAQSPTEVTQLHDIDPALAPLAFQVLAELKAQNERLQAAFIQQNAACAARLERLETGTLRPATLVSR